MLGFIQLHTIVKAVTPSYVNTPAGSNLILPLYYSVKRRPTPTRPIRRYVGLLRGRATAPFVVALALAVVFMAERKNSKPSGITIVVGTGTDTVTKTETTPGTGLVPFSISKILSSAIESKSL